MTKTSPMFSRMSGNNNKKVQVVPGQDGPEPKDGCSTLMPSGTGEDRSNGTSEFETQTAPKV